MSITHTHPNLTSEEREALLIQSLKACMNAILDRSIQTVA